MSGVDYGGGQDFRSKMAKFGAKLNNNGQRSSGFRPQSQQQNYGNNYLNDYKPMNHNNNNGMVKPSGGYGGNQQMRASRNGQAPRKILVKSKAARAMGRNEDAIKVNLDSVKSKVKFGRLVVYSVNCLANLAENKYNCEFIVEQGGVEAMKEVMKHHSSNPAVMKEVSRTLKNVAEANPAFAQKIIDDGMLEQCMNTLTSHPNECGVFALDIMDSVLKSAENPRAVAQRIVKNGGLKTLESALKKYPNNPDLCEKIVGHMNMLMAADSSITQKLGERQVWAPILDAMKAHPEHGQLAIQGTEALQVLCFCKDLCESAYKLQLSIHRNLPWQTHSTSKESKIREQSV